MIKYEQYAETLARYTIQLMLLLFGQAIVSFLVLQLIIQLIVAPKVGRCKACS